MRNLQSHTLNAADTIPAAVLRAMTPQAELRGTEHTCPETTEEDGELRAHRRAGKSPSE